MRIQHNIAAINAHRQLSNNNSTVSKSLEKLSSGYRINRAGDDAAGLAISEKMRSQIKGLETASKNSEDGISLIQTAEGALTEVHSMLNRMVELATQSANGTYNDNARGKIQDEISQLNEEIDRISKSTNFNGTNLLDGTMGGYQTTLTNTAAITTNGLQAISVSGGNLSNEAINVTFDADGKMGVSVNGAKVTFTAVTDTLKNGKSGSITFKSVLDPTATKADIDKWEGVSISILADKADSAGAYKGGNTTLRITGASKGLTLQVGDTSDDYQKVTVSVGNMNSENLKVNDINLASQTGSQSAIDKINYAIDQVSSTRGNLGALQNRLEHTINNLGVTTENMSAAESRVRDVDMAKEMMSYTKNNILVQASQAMLAQANQVPQGVLQLLQ